METTLIYPAVGVVGFGLLSAGASIAGAKRTAAGTKMLAASGYIALAVFGGALESSYGRVLLVGLCLCWLGDLLLIPPGQGRAFLGGLASFLCGHLLYAWAFHVRGIHYVWAACGGVLAVAVGAVVVRWLSRHDVPPPMRMPVRLYVAAITVMVALSVGTYGTGADWLIPIGAVAFMASDIFVARERFVTSSPWNTGLGLPLYFLGQVLLASSVMTP